MDNKRIEKVNMLFLVTILVTMMMSLIDLSFINNYIVKLLIGQVALILPVAVFLYIEKLPLKEALRIKKIKGMNIFLLVLLSFTITPVVNFINALSMVFVPNAVSVPMLYAVNNNSILLSVLVIAVVPAIFEEVAFRGVYYNSYKSGGIVKAALLSGLLFGVLHGNINQFSYALFVGVFFALVVEAVDSLWGGIILHFLFNFSNVMKIYLLEPIIHRLESMYILATASGNQIIVERIEEIMGGTDFSVGAMVEWSNQIAGQYTVLGVIVSYGFQAIIGGVLSFLIWRKIAQKEGRWEHIQKSFVKEKPERDLLCIKEDKTRFFTMPLIIAVSVMMILMFVAEVVP